MGRTGLQLPCPAAYIILQPIILVRTRDMALSGHVGSTGHSASVLPSPFDRASLRQRDGCILLRPRWGAGRMVHPPGRLLHIDQIRCRCLGSSHATDTILHHRLETASRKAI